MKYRMEELLEEGFAGSIFFYPEDQPILGAVMLLHGSEGHPSHHVLGYAASLALQGYATLYFAWYGLDITGELVPDLPTDIEKVNLQRSFDALSWLKDRVGCPTFLLGFSRGAEQAAIIASLFDLKSVLVPDGLILIAPSDKFYTACCMDEQGEWQVTNSPAWVWPGADGENNKTGQRIQIEAYPGPVLITHGCKDSSYDGWNVQCSEEIVKALRKRQEPKASVRALFFENEEHILGNKGSMIFFKELLKFLEQPPTDGKTVCEYIKT